jgi:hypothetical protein
MSNPFANSIGSVDSGPSRLWYLLPLVVVIAGMACMGAFLSNRLSGLGDSLVQVVVPGDAELTLDPGSYTIFHESRSMVDGRIFSVDSIAGLGVSLASAADEPVALAPASMSSSYEFAGRSGSAVFNFEIGDPGVYRLSAAYGDGAAGPRTVLAVGKGFGGDILTTLLGALAIAFAGMGLAAAIGWRVFVKRGAARRAGGGQAGEPA